MGQILYILRNCVGSMVSMHVLCAFLLLLCFLPDLRASEPRSSSPEDPTPLCDIAGRPLCPVLYPSKFPIRSVHVLFPWKRSPLTLVELGLSGLWRLCKSGEQPKDLSEEVKQAHLDIWRKTIHVRPIYFDPFPLPQTDIPATPVAVFMGQAPHMPYEQWEAFINTVLCEDALVGVLMMMGKRESSLSVRGVIVRTSAQKEQLIAMSQCTRIVTDHNPQKQVSTLGYAFVEDPKNSNLLIYGAWLSGCSEPQHPLVFEDVQNNTQETVNLLRKRNNRSGDNVRELAVYYKGNLAHPALALVYNNAQYSLQRPPLCLSEGPITLWDRASYCMMDY